MAGPMFAFPWSKPPVQQTQPAPTNTDPAPDANPAQQPPNNQQANPSNPDGDVDNFDNLWDDLTKSKDAPGGDQPPNTQNNSEPPNPRAALEEYIKKQNLFPPIDPTQLADSLAKGDLSYLNTHIQSAIEGVFEKALTASHKMVTEGINRAVTEAVAKSGTNFSATQAMTELHNQLPFTQEKSIAPIAQAVMKQCLDRHNGDARKAVRDAHGYFKSMMNKMRGGEDSLPSDNFPFSRRGGDTPPFMTEGGQSTPRNSDDPPNFLELLRAN